MLSFDNDLIGSSVRFYYRYAGEQSTGKIIAVYMSKDNVPTVSIKITEEGHDDKGSVVEHSLNGLIVL